MSKQIERRRAHKFEGSAKELVASAPTLPPALLERIRDLLFPHEPEALKHNRSDSAAADHPS